MKRTSKLFSRLFRKGSTDVALPSAFLGLTLSCHVLAAPHAEPSRVTIGLALADIDYFYREGKKPPLESYPARAAYYRAVANLKRSDEWADRCISNSDVNGQAGSYALYQCMSIAAGNKRIRNDIDGWARDMIAIRRLVASSATLTAIADAENLDLAKTPFESFVGLQPLTVEGDLNKITDVPIRYINQWPVVELRLSGGADGIKRSMDVEFVVDTGSPTSTVSSGFSERLKLSKVSDYQNEVRRDRRSRSALVEPVDLSIGGITLRNVSLVENEQTTINVIGQDVLRALGPTLLNDEVLRILGRSWKYTGCDQRLRMTSHPTGRYWQLWMPAVINGTSSLLHIDTGMSGVLEVHGLRNPPKTLPPFTPNRVSTMVGPVDRTESKMVVNVNGSELDNTMDALVVQEKGVAPMETWRLGGGILKTHDLLINLDAMFLCVYKRG